MCPLSLVISHLSSEVAAAAAAAVVTRNDEIWGANRRRDQSAVSGSAHRVPRHISVAAPARSPPSGRPALFGRRYLRAEPIDGVVGVCTVANAHVTRGGYRACGTLSFWKAGRSGRPAPAVSWCRAGVAGERARTWRASMGPTERSPVNERAGWHDEWGE
jgi:hypothetical protein